MLQDYLIFAIRSLKHRQLRTWLTVIGIIIGIGSIIALISISQGLENAIVEQFERMGSNRIYIAPEGFLSAMAMEGLTTRDVERVEKMPEVEWTNPYVYTSSEIEFSNEKQFVQQFLGIDTDGLAQKWEDMDFKLIEGRLPEKKQKGIAVLGYKIAKDVFKKEIHLKNKIKVKDEEFRVTGVMEEIGNEDDDTAIYIDIDDFRELFDKPEEVNAIEVKIKPGLDVNLVAEKIEERLARARDDENFEVLTPEQMLAQVGEILNIIRLVLGGIAAISLIVGGVGIMNSMYTSVLQRRREVGVMKSVGAKNKDVMLVFLVESGLLGIGGGILGVALGSGIALATGYVAAQQGFALLSIKLSWQLSLFGLIFALLVGMAAGVLPARQAAKLRPAEALRG